MGTVTFNWECVRQANGDIVVANATNHTNLCSCGPFNIKVCC